MKMNSGRVWLAAGFSWSLASLFACSAQDESRIGLEVESEAVASGGDFGFGGTGSGNPGFGGDYSCPNPAPCYPVNRVYSPTYAWEGCPCVRSVQGAPCSQPGHLRSICDTVSSFCGYLLCMR